MKMNIGQQIEALLLEHIDSEAYINPFFIRAILSELSDHYDVDNDTLDDWCDDLYGQ